MSLDPVRMVSQKGVETDEKCCKRGDQGYSCERKATMEVSWEHFHRGAWKTSSRRWCQSHASRFMNRHQAHDATELAQ